MQIRQNADSKLIAEREKVQDMLVESINIIKIGNEEAITLNNDFLANNEFMLKMLQKIDPNFMMSELKIEKTDIT